MLQDRYPFRVITLNPAYCINGYTIYASAVGIPKVDEEQYVAVENIEIMKIILREMLALEKGTPISYGPMPDPKYYNRKIRFLRVENEFWYIACDGDKTVYLRSPEYNYRYSKADLGHWSIQAKYVFPYSIVETRYNQSSELSEKSSIFHKLFSKMKN